MYHKGDSAVNLSCHTCQQLNSLIMFDSTWEERPPFGRGLKTPVAPGQALCCWLEIPSGSARCQEHALKGRALDGFGVCHISSGFDGMKPAQELNRLLSVHSCG